MQPVSELNYNQALAELEQILAQLRSDDCDVDRLTALTARAVDLLNHCRSRLTATDLELRTILRNLSQE
ncbi:MAG: exodeoxyribonuclease VII small subunit [Muribaculaceae bacterium]|nr:exodeoxyribonuclease VII small subunit [Muribaculaceae bacterium]